jgi:hypothetical protein
MSRSRPERIFEEAADLVRWLDSDSRRRARRRRRQRRRRTFKKILKTWAWMVFATCLVVGGMISTGHLLGPRGVEGLLALPVVLVAVWGAILYASFGRRKAALLPQALVQSDLAQLPARTEEWLDDQRRALPAAAQSQLDTIVSKLELLAPQLQKLDPQTPAAVEVRRLLGEELPELVRGYQKVPSTLQRQPLYGGPSPDRQLIDGLSTIEQEIGRMHTRLATDDLHALATQQRYLESKYKTDDDDKP